MKAQGVNGMIKPIAREIGPERPAENNVSAQEETHVSSRENKKPESNWKEHLARNLALACMLVISVTAVRSAQLPSGETMLTAVQRMIDAEWDERLGKISFVSNLFPETVAVFFESPPDASWIAPCFGEVSHVWTESEPYVAYQSGDARVFAMASGQVMSVAHGPGEERIVRVRQDDGLEVLYYNLARSAVAEGDTVTSSTCIGEALAEGVVIEVRRAGRAIDPTGCISPRSGDAR